MATRFETAPLSPSFGTEVKGLDLSRELDDETFAALYQTWLDSDGIVVVRDQEMSEAQHVAFSRRFGPIFDDEDTVRMSYTVTQYLHPEWPQIYRVSNITDSKGQPLGRRKAGTYWHSDVSFLVEPAQASILLAIELPPIGGDTMFANLTAAHTALSDAMKSLLDGMKVVHDFAVASAGWQHETKSGEDLTSRTRNTHPIVRTHAETGRKSLFINRGFTSHLADFDPEESQALLGFLLNHSEQPEFIYRHRWRPHDMVIWDNRCVMHRAIADYPDGHRRHLHRTTVIGERPI